MPGTQSDAHKLQEFQRSLREIGEHVSAYSYALSSSDYNALMVTLAVAKLQTLCSNATSKLAELDKGTDDKIKGHMEKVLYAKFLDDWCIPYVGREHGSLDDALALLSGECFVLFYTGSADEQCKNAVLLFNDLWLRGASAVFVDRTVCSEDYDVPPGQRLMRYAHGRVLDTDYRKLPDSGRLRVITAQWTVDEIATHEVFQSMPRKLRRQLNPAVASNIVKRFLWANAIAPGPGHLRVELTAEHASLMLANRQYAMTIMRQLSQNNCVLRCELHNGQYTLRWSVAGTVREIVTTGRILSDLLEVMRQFVPDRPMGPSIERLELDVSEVCIGRKEWTRLKQGNLATIKRLAIDVSTISLIGAREVEKRTRTSANALRSRWISDFVGRVVKRFSRTLRTLEGVTETCLLPSATLQLDMLDVDLLADWWRWGCASMAYESFNEFTRALLRTRSSELRVHLRGNLPPLACEVMDDKVSSPEFRIIRLSQSLSSSDPKPLHGFAPLKQVVRLGLDCCAALEQLHVCMKRVYTPEVINDGDRQTEFSNEALRSCRRFAEYAQQLRLQTPSELQIHATLVIQVQAVPTNTADEFVRTTNADGSIGLEWEQMSPRGTTRAVVVTKST